MDINLAKIIIIQLVTENKKNVYSVESLLIEIKKNNNVYNDNEVRDTIREALKALSNNPNFIVVMHGVKSITYNNENNSNGVVKSFDDNKIIIEKDISNNILLTIMAVWLIHLFIDNTFLFICSSLFSVLSILLLKDDNSNIPISENISSKLGIIAPIFALTYCILGNSIISKYSYLSLDPQISSNSNMYYISIALLLSVLGIVTLKNRLAFIIFSIFMFFFFFIKPSITLILIICIGIFYFFIRTKNFKYLSLFNDYIKNIDDILKNKNSLNTILFSFTLMSLILITNSEDDLKKSYYNMLKESNNGYCINLTSDLKIIKENSKAGYVTIASVDLIEPLIIFIANKSNSFSDVVEIDQDINIFDKITYNGIIKNIKNNKEKWDALKKKSLTLSDEYIFNNNNLIKKYLTFKNHYKKNRDYLFSYECK